LKIHGEYALMEGVTHGVISRPGKRALATWDYTLLDSGRVSSELSQTKVLDVWGGETTVTIFLRQNDGSFRNTVVRSWNLDFKAPIGMVIQGSADIPIGQLSVIADPTLSSEEQALKNQMSFQHSEFQKLAIKHPRLFNVIGEANGQKVRF
jgi:hypothetical protein